MDAVAVTIIGVVGTALFGMFFMQFKNLRDDMTAGFAAVNSRLDRQDARLDSLIAAVHALDTKFTGLFSGLETRFENLETRFDRLETKVDALDEKFTAQLHDHGERLARIEAHLRINPPAEAA